VNTKDSPTRQVRQDAYLGGLLIGQSPQDFDDSMSYVIAMFASPALPRVSAPPHCCTEQEGAAEFCREQGGTRQTGNSQLGMGNMP